MAITRDKQATGSKTTTSGTTFTIALSSAAGAVVYVSVAMVGTTVSVSSITDGGGNTYDRIKSQVGSTDTVELWKSRTTNASGTLTVTVNATGFRCAGAAASYKGVAFGSDVTGGTTGSTSPITTGAQTMIESADFLIMAGSLAANNTFTAQNGTIEGQVGTTSLRGILISNTGGTSVTDSATMTAAAWAIAWTTVRAITVPADTLSMSDAESQQIGGAIGITDVMQITDADSGNLLAGTENIDYGGFGQWLDALTMKINVGAGTRQLLALVDGFWYEKITSQTGGVATPPGITTLQEFWNEGAPVQGIQFQISIACPHLNNWADFTPTFSLGYTMLINQSMNNWLDAVTVSSGGGITPMTLTLSDQDTTWNDVVLAGYGALTSDQLIITDSIGAGYGGLLSDSDAANWSDKLLAGYGSLTSDQLIITDSLGAGYGALLSDSLNSWNDVLAKLLSIALVLTDQDTTWNDALGIGYGNSESDQMVFSDALGAGYGSATSDQLVIADSLGAGYGALLSDSLNSWQDAFNDVLLGAQIQLTLSDNLNNWSDLVLAGYGSATSDQIVLSDSIGAGYGALLSDQDTTWLDALRAGYGAATSDQIIFADSLGAGYGGGLSDNLNNWQDSKGIGFGLVLSDNLNNWNDLVGVVLGLTLQLSDDNEANWDDFVPSFIEEFDIGIGEQLSMSDSLGAGYGAATSDQIVIVDSLGAGYGALLSDNLNSWNDAFVENLIGAQQQLTLSDNLNNWADLVRAGYGATTSDQLVITDSLGAGYGGLLSDNLNSWADTKALTLGMIETLSDSLNNWSDKVLAGYGAATSDQIIFADSTGAGYGALLSDNLNSWADAFSDVLFGAQIQIMLSDNLNNWSDLVRAGYGNLTSDQLVLSDSLGAGYGAVLSDSITTWLDAVTELLSIAITLSDNLNNWSDKVLAGYGAATSDQLVIADSLGAGYGALLSDSLNGWNDITAKTLAYLLTLTDNWNTWADTVQLAIGLRLLLTDQDTTWLDAVQTMFGQGLTVSDTLTLQDSIAAGYGALLTEQLAWQDALGGGYGLFITDNLNVWQEIVLGTGLTGALSVTINDQWPDWVDALQTFLSLNHGLAVSQALRVYQKFTAALVNVESGVTAAITVTPRDVQSWNVPMSTPDYLALALQIQETIDFWNDNLDGTGTGLFIAELMVMEDGDQVTMMTNQQFDIGFSDNMSNWNELLTGSLN